METKAKIISLVFALAIAALAIALRARAVEQLPIDYDEDDYLRAGQQVATALQTNNPNEILNLNYRPEHPQLQKLLYGLVLFGLPQVEEIPDRPTTSAPATSLPQPHLHWARAASALLNAVLVFLLALLNPLAGLILAVHTYTIKYTSQVMLESLPMLTSFLAVYCYNRSGGKFNRWLVFAAIALGLTAASKYLFAIVAVPIIIDWLIARNKTPSKRLLAGLGPMVMWGVIAFAIFFIFNPYLWPSPVDRLAASLTFHGGYTQSDTVQQANLPFWQPFIWLFSSVPWHPGVFLVSLDLLITLAAVIGLPDLFHKYRVYALWLLSAIVFLLIWPTKWAQYVLVLMVPVSLAAAVGLQRSAAAFSNSWKNLRKKKAASYRGWLGDLRRTAPWLAPGLLVLGLIALYPLVYQIAMSLTDLTAASIKDGLNGGIWREVWLGITGQVEPVAVRFFSFNPSREVSYAGPNLLLGILFSSEGASLLVFELVWSLLAVGIQVALGVAAALVVSRYSTRIRNILYAVLILPWAIPEFVGALMWLQIFDPRFGWFVLAQTNFTQRIDLPFLIEPIIPAWQDDPGLALVYLLIPAVWYGFPFMMLAASAGLKTIPGELNEAAKIDGASAWQRFSAVTLPMLLPLLLPAVIIRLIFAFNQFYLFLTFQTPFPVTTFATSSYSLFTDGGAYAFSAGLNIVAIIFLVVGILLVNRWTRASSGVTYAA